MRISRYNYKDKDLNSYLPTTLQELQSRPRYRTRRNLCLSCIGILAFLSYVLLRTLSNASDAARWRKLAYVTYATDQNRLCGAVMLFSSLHKETPRPDKVLFYPESWDVDISGPTDRTSQLLVMARDKFQVKLKPVEMYKHRRLNVTEPVIDDTGKVLNMPEVDEYWYEPDGEGTWDSSVNIIHAWGLEEYTSIVFLSTDTTFTNREDSSAEPALGPILEDFASHNGERASLKVYAKPQIQLGSNIWTHDTLMMLTPSHSRVKMLWDLAGDISSAATEDLGMQRNLIGAQTLQAAFGTDTEFASPSEILLETSKLPYYESSDLASLFKTPKLIRFNDHPLPKPWVMWPNNLMMELRPKCRLESDTPRESDCGTRQIWMQLYDEYRRQRKDVCGLLSVPAPEWPPRKKTAKSEN